MARVGVDVERLREGAQALKRTCTGARPSADDGARFGSSLGRGAVARFEAYWVPGQSALDELAAGLAGALEQVAGASERRDAEDASRFRVDGGEVFGF